MVFLLFFTLNLIFLNTYLIVDNSVENNPINIYLSTLEKYFNILHIKSKTNTQQKIYFLLCISFRFNM